MASSDQFSPRGLRVLVVDSDNSTLLELQNMLTKSHYHYQVKICNTKEGAVDMLGEKNEMYGFDMVMSEVVDKQVDDFVFLQLVVNKFDIPIIIMTASGDLTEVKKGIDSGACQVLLKPLKTKDITYIWQHVCRKRLQRQRQIHEQEINDNSSNLGESMEKKEVGETSNSANKKPRFRWDAEVHDKFLEALKQSQTENRVGAVRIMELMKSMGVTELTKDQVGSHLQSHRSKTGKIATKVSSVAANPQHEHDHAIISNNANTGQPLQLQQQHVAAAATQVSSATNNNPSTILNNLRTNNYSQYYPPSIPNNFHTNNYPQYYIPNNLHTNNYPLLHEPPSIPNNFHTNNYPQLEPAFIPNNPVVAVDQDLQHSNWNSLQDQDFQPLQQQHHPNWNALQNLELPYSQNQRHLYDNQFAPLLQTNNSRLDVAPYPQNQRLYNNQPAPPQTNNSLVYSQNRCIYNNPFAPPDPRPPDFMGG